MPHTQQGTTDNQQSDALREASAGCALAHEHVAGCTRTQDAGCDSGDAEGNALTVALQNLRSQVSHLETFIPNTPQDTAYGYPTHAEIMTPPAPEYSDEMLAAVKLWKLEHYKGWGGKPLQERLDSLRTLVQRMARAAGTSVLCEEGPGYCYMPRERKILLDAQRPSIISTMHEFAHHLHGPSELTACRWSVWLFRTRFPRSFERLGFSGHMLMRPEDAGRVRQLPPGTYQLPNGELLTVHAEPALNVPGGDAT